MSDLLTRLAERALGVAAPALEPRLPSRYAGASAAADDDAFSEQSAEIDARPSPSIPRRPPSPPRIAEPSIAPPPPAPFGAGEPPRAADEGRGIHPPAAPPAVPPRTERAPADAHPADPPRPAAQSAHAAPSRPPREDGLREVDAFHEAEDDFAPLFPSARARRTETRRVDAGADDPHRPRVVESSPHAGPADATDAVRAEAADGGRDAAPRAPDSAGDEDGFREVVKVVEREPDGRARPRAASPPAVADAPRRTNDAPARMAERGPAAERAEGREAEEPARPVVRVTIGRIEVRAAPAAPAPQPAARPGWTPPVMPLADYLKREAGR